MIHDHRFPGEGPAYRAARDELLAEEIGLRRRTEQVAALRRALPCGGRVREDYIFEEGATDLADRSTARKTRFPQLFEPGKATLVVYSFMYPPDGHPCPMCTSFLDGLNGNALHIRQRVNLAVVAKAPNAAIRDWARGRGWQRLRLLSSAGTSYNRDYHAESPDGDQWPMLNVFSKESDGIYHRYATELLLVDSDPGQDPRHLDPLWTLWNVLDLTPEGRGAEWYPQPSYD